MRTLTPFARQSRLLLPLSLAGFLGLSLLVACGEGVVPPEPAPAPPEAATGAPTETPTEVATEAPTGTPAETPTEHATEAATETPTQAATPASAPTATPARTTDPTPEPRSCDVSRAPWSSFRQSAREEARDRVRQPDGAFIGRYTGVVRSQDGIQVDHIVPRNYACENGGLDWDDEQIRDFVNDQDNLAVVASSENTRKGDKGPAGYLPALDRCWYAARWEALAQRYDLDLPARDQAVLDATLAEPACETSSDATATPEAIATPTPTPTPTPTSTPAAGTTYASCDAAEAAGEERMRGGNGPGRGFPAHLVPSARDGDGDGVVCER